ncbi:MAG: serine/threonine protein kinase [Pirellulales bacterium]|nr:serine/threonine protein kinase [Pirellulales bacterium]
MTTEPEVGRHAQDAHADSSDVVELVEAYCAERSQGAAIEPEDWLRARGGDASLGEELRIIDLLREASSLIEDHASVDTTHCWQPPTPPTAAPAMAGDQPVLSLGELLDAKLRILGQLGAGGMGEVYVAWHEVLEREVAVKVLLEEHAADDSSIGRFRKSIAMQARISSHQHIVGTLDAGVHRGHIYLVTEYVPGADLAAILQARHPLPWREVSEWIRQAAVGLAHAHRAGLVHRDIKPGNLILALDGTIKLLDWGLARAGSSGADDADDGRTAANVALGTFDYMAPEQARDAATADARSDLYSLGCTFYQLLAGRAPFGHHKSRLAKVQAHGSEPPPPLDTLRRDVPGRVQSVIGRLLEKDPARRYPTAQEFADTLEAILAGDAAAGVAPRKSRRRLLLPVVAVTCALLLVFVGWQVITPPVPPAVPPTWTQLELFTAADPTDKSQPHDPVYVVISDGYRQPPQRIRTFGGPEAFRLDGRFNRPTSWAVVWIDDPPIADGEVTVGGGTAANFHLLAAGEGSVFAYPKSSAESSDFMTVSPTTTPGVHDVVLVLVIDRDDDKHRAVATGLLSEQLNRLPPEGWPVPPVELDSMVCTNPATSEAAIAFRSPGQQVAGQTAHAYLQSIESRLPAGVRPLAAFFVRSEPRGDE